MDFLIRQFRPDPYSSREQRLCYDTPEGSIESAAKSVTKFAIGSVEFGLGMSKDVFNGIYNAWNADTQSEQVKNGQLATIAEFSRTAAPSLQRIIEEKFRQNERPTLDEIVVLFSQEQWLNFFAEPNNFSVISEADALINPNAGIPLRATTIREGQAGIFQGLDTEQRELFYYEHVSGLIPLPIRDDPRFSEYFGDVTKTQKERAHIMRNNVPMIDASMRLILGLALPNPDTTTRPHDIPFQIAHESLMHHYWRDGKRYLDDGTHLPFDLFPAERLPDGTFVKLGNGLKPQFRIDMERATDAELYMSSTSDVARSLGPSILKGALNADLGIMEPDDIPVLQKWIADRSMNRVMNKHVNANEVRSKTNVIKNQNARETQTLADSYGNLGGFEKIALLGLAVMALTNKTVRNIGLGLGALYFGQKLLLKQEDPINDTWLPMIQAPFKKLADVTREPFKHFGIEFDKQKYTDAEMQKRIGIMDNFLSERARQELSTSLTGFTLLADMSLGSLAQYFEITSDASLASVKHQDPNFKKQIRQKLSEHGLDAKAAERFFGGADPETISDPVARKELGMDTTNKHLKESGKGLATVFYMLAVREPQHKRSMRLIEYCRSYMGNGSYQDLPIGEHYPEILDEDGVKRNVRVNPRELYAHLVREGMQLASGNEMSLLDFVTSEIGNDPRPIHVQPYVPVSSTASAAAATRGTPPPTGPAYSSGIPPVAPPAASTGTAPLSGPSPIGGASPHSGPTPTTGLSPLPGSAPSVGSTPLPGSAPSVGSTPLTGPAPTIGLPPSAEPTI